jgi:hypothetical protein
MSDAPNIYLAFALPDEQNLVEMMVLTLLDGRSLL